MEGPVCWGQGGGQGRGRGAPGAVPVPVNVPVPAPVPGFERPGSDSGSDSGEDGRARARVGVRVRVRDLTPRTPSHREHPRPQFTRSSPTRVERGRGRTPGWWGRGGRGTPTHTRRSGGTGLGRG